VGGRGDGGGVKSGGSGVTISGSTVLTEEVLTISVLTGEVGTLSVPVWFTVQFVRMTTMTIMSAVANRSIPITPK
jgi:hypothetical protein